ncbi:MAG: hypothetical protein Q8O41_11870 [Candidatus Methanoperedens sp.]|nr:hypothetical protein [Candidatus Methanoperedens sp.]
MDYRKVDYGKYLRCGLPRFYEILIEERYRRIMTRHHVFTGRLLNGAKIKKKWHKNELEMKFFEFELDMDEIKFLPASDHCVLNQVSRNYSPPAILKEIEFLINGIYVGYETKRRFAKFLLCVIEERIEKQNPFAAAEEELKEIDKIVAQKIKIIDIDVNNGNKMSIKEIMSCLGITGEDIARYLKRKFFPRNWEKYPKELWDLYG